MGEVPLYTTSQWALQIHSVSWYTLLDCWYTGILFSFVAQLVGLLEDGHFVSRHVDWTVCRDLLRGDRIRALRVRGPLGGEESFKATGYEQSKGS